MVRFSSFSTFYLPNADNGYLSFFAGNVYPSGHASDCNRALQVTASMRCDPVEPRYTSAFPVPGPAFPLRPVPNPAPLRDPSNRTDPGRDHRKCHSLSTKRASPGSRTLHLARAGAQTPEPYPDVGPNSNQYLVSRRQNLFLHGHFVRVLRMPLNTNAVFKVYALNMRLRNPNKEPLKRATFPG